MEKDHTQTAPEQTTPAKILAGSDGAHDDSFAGFVDTYEGGQEDNVPAPV